QFVERPRGGTAPLLKQSLNLANHRGTSLTKCSAHQNLVMRHVSPSSGGVLGAVARPSGVEASVSVDALVGVGAEIVAQTLDQGGGQAFAAQAVVISEGSGERGCRDGGGCGPGHDPPPAGGAVTQRAGEVGGDQQAGQGRVAIVSHTDAVEEARPDDAAAPPDRCHGARVDIPPVLLA